MGTTRERRHMAAGLSLSVASARCPHRLWLSILAGRWCFCMQFRRAASSVFTEVWSSISHWKPCRFLAQPVALELLQAVFLGPLLETNLRAAPDLLVTASDASESGGGACAAAGLTTKGVDFALGLSAEMNPGMPRNLTAKGGIVLISLFGGIEAGRRALDLLGVQPLRHVSAELDSASVRVAASVYPNVIHIRDVRELSRERLSKLLGGVDPLFVLLVAGSPCQGLSGLNATKKGFEDVRSALFFETVRIAKLIRQEKFEYELLNENAASMSQEDRAHTKTSRYLLATPSGRSGTVRFK